MLTERLLIQLRPSSVLSVRLCQTMVCPFLTTGAFVPMLVLPCGTLSAIWATRGSSYPILLQAIVAVTLLAISTRSHSQGLSSCSAISTTRVFPLATATSKQAPTAISQIEHLGLSSIFGVVAGATPDPSSSKATVIREALTRLEAMGADISHPVLVGDSIWDVRGAQEAGIPVIGVGWGYATEDGLDDADAVCETVEDLRTFILEGVAQAKSQRGR